MSGRFVNPQVRQVPPSGIRRFFDIAGTMRDAISLGVGEPDFITPYHIRAAAIDSLLDGETQYTPNLGLLSLRREIAEYLTIRFQVSYDPEKEIMVTVGASEAIDLALRACVRPGDEVILPDPETAGDRSVLTLYSCRWMISSAGTGTYFISVFSPDLTEFYAFRQIAEDHLRWK